MTTKLASSSTNLVYYILIVISIISIISIVYFFNKTSSLQSNVKSLLDFKEDISSFKSKISDLDLKNTLNSLQSQVQNIELPKVIKSAGNDDGTDTKTGLTPNQVFNMIKRGNSGIIEQQYGVPTDIFPQHVYVLTNVPSVDDGFISQLILTQLGKNNTNNLYMRYSTGTIKDIDKNLDSGTWTDWSNLTSV
jgi:hypothetical protein